MTRMWNVNPELMCDQHLLGEHREMHQEVGTLENHPHGRAVVKGHADREQVDTALIQERHDQLVEEMKKRGFKHESPLDYSDSLELGNVDEEKNLEDLASRCGNCRERIKKAV